MPVNPRKVVEEPQRVLRRQLSLVRLNRLQRVDQVSPKVLEAGPLLVESLCRVADRPLQRPSAGRRAGAGNDHGDGVQAVVKRGTKLVQKLAEDEAEFGRHRHDPFHQQLPAAIAVELRDESVRPLLEVDTPCCPQRLVQLLGSVQPRAEVRELRNLRLVGHSLRQFVSGRVGACRVGSVGEGPAEPLPVLGQGRVHRSWQHLGQVILRFTGGVLGRCPQPLIELLTGRRDA